MFEGIEAAANDEGAGKGRFAASTGISVGICVILGVVLAAVGTGVARSSDTDQQDVQVSFHEPAAPEPKIDEPPPPPPAPRPKLERRSANTQAKVPTILPGDQLAEGDENDFRGSGSDAIEELTAPVLPDELVSSAPPPPPPPDQGPMEPADPGRDPAPIFVPDDGIAPQALAGNASPAYPEDARKKGQEAVVVLRFVVTRDGRVADIQVIEGAEPFVSAAIAVVKTWRYSPARVDGRTEDAWHRVRLPFQLKT